jgi:drug/metabolite transporter (DMT)-like permease
VAYRFVVAGLTMAAVASWRGDRWPTDARGLGFAFVLGLFQFCLNFNFVYQAERYVTSGLVAVTFGLMLVPNALLGRVFLGQRLGAQLLVGSAIAVAGIALLFAHEARVDPNGPAQVLLGVGLTLFGVLSASVTNVMQGSATARAYPMASMLAAGMLMGAAIDAAFAYAVAGPPVVELRLGYLVGVLYLGVFASAVAFT